MKKLGIIVSILMLFVFAGFNTSLAADFSVNEIHWDDSNCSCSEPVQADVRIVIVDLNNQTTVHDSGWITDVDEYYTYEASDDDIKTDCVEPCYKVIVYVRLKDSGGQCCSGYDEKNTTGYDLVFDQFYPDEVILN